jgi:hypothetical protein
MTMRRVNCRTLDHVSRRIDYEAEAAMIAKERYPIPSLVIVNPRSHRLNNIHDEASLRRYFCGTPA